MIHNFLIVKNDILLVVQDLCHFQSLSSDMQVVSGYLSALEKFSEEFSGEMMEKVELKDYVFHFFKPEYDPTLLFIAVTDTYDSSEEIHTLMVEIAHIFYKRFSKELKQFMGKINPFKYFGDTIIEMTQDYNNHCEIP